MNKLISKILVMISVVAIVLALIPVSTASAATSSEIKEAQTIANKFGLQVGAVDGVFGANSARGFCMFRYLSRMTPSRSNLDSTLLSKMRDYNARYPNLQSIPSGTSAGSNTFLVAQKTCQMMVYARSGNYSAVTPISTGKNGLETPNGTWNIGYTQRGWSCSSLYPESCITQTQGRFTNISNYGNMYNKRSVTGAIKVHGSTSVPTYPASHGCIRVPISFSDWMYDNVNANIPITVTGAY